MSAARWRQRDGREERKKKKKKKKEQKEERVKFITPEKWRAGAGAAQSTAFIPTNGRDKELAAHGKDAPRHLN